MPGGDWTEGWLGWLLRWVPTMRIFSQCICTSVQATHHRVFQCKLTTQAATCIRKFVSWAVDGAGQNVKFHPRTLCTVRNIKTNKGQNCRDCVCKEIASFTSQHASWWCLLVLVQRWTNWLYLLIVLCNRSWSKLTLNLASSSSPLKTTEALLWMWILTKDTFFFQQRKLSQKHVSSQKNAKVHVVVSLYMCSRHNGGHWKEFVLFMGLMPWGNARSSLVSGDCVSELNDRTRSEKGWSSWC